MLADASVQNQKSKVYQVISSVFPEDALYFANRSVFNEDQGLKCVKRLALKSSIESVVFGSCKKYFAYSAVSALFSFLEQELSLEFPQNTIKFSTSCTDGSISVGKYNLQMNDVAYPLFRLSFGKVAGTRLQFQGPQKQRPFTGHPRQHKDQDGP